MEAGELEDIERDRRPAAKTFRARSRVLELLGRGVCGGSTWRDVELRVAENHKVIRVGVMGIVTSACMA